MAGFVQGVVSCGDPSEEGRQRQDLFSDPGTDSWESIKAAFLLGPEKIHMAGLLIASHPAKVGEAISQYRENRGRSPGEVVHRLPDKNIIASSTPYDRTHARLTPGIYNTPEDTDQVLREIMELA